MTNKQKVLAGIVMSHRSELIKYYSGPRLAQYVSGVRIPDYKTAQHIAKVAGRSVEDVAYRKEIINL